MSRPRSGRWRTGIGRWVRLVFARGVSVSLGGRRRRLTVSPRGVTFRMRGPVAGLAWTWARSWRQIVAPARRERDNAQTRRRRRGPGRSRRR